MLKSANDLKGAGLAATDGAIGSVHDLYFDDSTWTIRYLVIDTGTWLPGRRVLISPLSVRPGVPGDDTVPVALTRAQVENAPSADSDQPVDRRYEEEYSRYYGYPYYWAGPYRWGSARYPGEPEPAGGTTSRLDEPALAASSMLRSARDVTGYYIEATDGDIGHVEDFIVDDREWAIRYLVVDTRNWWPGGKKVLVSPDWVREVSWADSRVYVNLTRDGVKAAPEYDPSQPLERAYETNLYRHYGRPHYWE